MLVPVPVQELVPGQELELELEQVQEQELA